MKRIPVLIIVILSSISCHNQQGQNKETDIRMNAVCKIEEEPHLVGRALSLDISNDGSFIISNGSEIMGYDASGHQKYVLNREGRGPYEYLIAKRVRRYDDTIYVWDSGSARFLAYDLEGNGLWTFDYESAICDFYPTESSIFIYPCGRKWDYLVEELDLESLSITNSIGSSSMAQKAFHAMDAAVPLAVDRGSLYFMSRDKLDLYKCDLDHDDEPVVVERFHSDTFQCSDINEDELMNPTSAIQFIFQNSFVVTFAIDGDSYRLFTAEGSADAGKIQPDGHMKVSNNTLVFRLYSPNEEGYKVAVCERTFDPQLISVRDGRIYALIDNPDDERFPYQLVTLE